MWLGLNESFTTTTKLFVRIDNMESYSAPLGIFFATIFASELRFFTTFVFNMAINVGFIFIRVATFVRAFVIF